ncbi:MAG: HAMP domain-containing histidine kinase [Deltaproteobacteria bacterium]|nr:HAMP domain-containing histidine kinase [Deltaproteobacteria bacterium]
MKSKIQTKFLAPILILQLIALGTLGYIGYRFSSDMLKVSAEKRFSKTIEATYGQIENTLQERIDKIKTLLRNPLFIKFSAAPHYKSDVDVEVFNFQKGNGLLLGEPTIGGTVNYPIGLLANEGNKGIVNAGIFPSEEYVDASGIVKQHVYLGGSNDVDFETEEDKKLDRSKTEWFKSAIEGNLYIGKPQEMSLHLREYEPITISAKEVLNKRQLIPIAIPHRIGPMIVGVFMVTTTPDFIYASMPKGDLKTILSIFDKSGGVIASAGNERLEKSIHYPQDRHSDKVDQGKILDDDNLLGMYRVSPLSGWNIAMYGLKTDIYGGVYRLRANIIIIMVASILVMGIIVFFIIRKLLKPVLKLTGASDRIANGELGVTIPKSDDDEIGQLTESFNKMSTSTKDMHDRLSQMNYVRKQLLQIISHELRTPLNGIIGFYDLMKTEISDEKVQDYDEFQECFDRLGGSIDRYKKLVERLTKTTSVMSGEMRTENEMDEHCNLVEASWPALNEARKFSENITENLGSDELQNIEIACPANAIKLMLDEALSNAIKYSPEGESVDIKFTSDKNNVAIIVTDKGSGIPSGYINEVIEPFFEVKDSKLHFTDRYKKGGGGLGLGLTIIGSILRRYQGTLNIDSEEGKGTTLTMTLPIFN